MVEVAAVVALVEMEAPWVVRVAAIQAPIPEATAVAEVVLAAVPELAALEA